MIEKLSIENSKVKEEYAKQTKILEEKIETLTKENSELRKEVNRMNSILIKLGIVL
jgi:chaperonin cofactor prefoldin